LIARKAEEKEEGEESCDDDKKKAPSPRGLILQRKFFINLNL